ncbi:hypothetical protein CC1G_14605 [Coprinopsis cinerea okayama7|uniref:Uncharacterized protein n=1 Tax=Coprinopsis cinerea (strain Okayama-7 / 130 / ATCC MYA-4618 / FGSC 9003) TaxID=240176 RepID=D6RMH9_COPC7|nr:hypothetical protein CC1G_14605 [Coprinopsis cinerea okayama7\|eukprot:XP_002911174.1 hypothetical protein CC1G_14605 [Coprinopsis cinerea okayama7\
MSEPGGHRRQPPSPLVFGPDTVLSPIPLQAQSSTASSHGSGSNTVSMPFVRRHVTRRLKAAKAECDKELQRVTNNVTAFFEERLREGDQDIDRDHRERPAEGRDRDSQLGDHDHLREPFVFQTAELGTTAHNDEYSSDGGYEAESEFSRHSRQRGISPDEPRLATATIRRSLGQTSQLIGLLQCGRVKPCLFHDFASRSNRREEAEYRYTSHYLVVLRRQLFTPLVEEHSYPTTANRFRTELSLNLTFSVTIASHLFSCKFLGAR